MKKNIIISTIVILLIILSFSYVQYGYKCQISINKNYKNIIHLAGMNYLLYKHMPCENTVGFKSGLDSIILRAQGKKYYREYEKRFKSYSISLICIDSLIYARVMKKGFVCNLTNNYYDVFLYDLYSLNKDNKRTKKILMYDSNHLLFTDTTKKRAIYSVVDSVFIKNFGGFNIKRYQCDMLHLIFKKKKALKINSYIYNQSKDSFLIWNRDPRLIEFRTNIYPILINSKIDSIIIPFYFPMDTVLDNAFRAKTINTKVETKI